MGKTLKEFVSKSIQIDLIRAGDFSRKLFHFLKGAAAGVIVFSCALLLCFEGVSFVR